MIFKAFFIISGLLFLAACTNDTTQLVRTLLPPQDDNTMDVEEEGGVKEGTKPTSSTVCGQYLVHRLHALCAVDTLRSGFKNPPSWDGKF